MNIILSVVLGLMSVVYVLRIALGELKLNNFIILTLSFSFFLFVISSNNTQTYDESYNNTMQDTTLVSTTEYQLQRYDTLLRI